MVARKVAGGGGWEELAKWEMWASSYGMSKSRESRHSIGNIVNDVVIVFHGTEST